MKISAVRLKFHLAHGIAVHVSGALVPYLRVLDVFVRMEGGQFFLYLIRTKRTLSDGVSFRNQGIISHNPHFHVDKLRCHKKCN